ncbi:ribonuclease H-like domain-containing protein [[Pseudomonas] boreopolis]|uniref:ribonuclease H-like domain-containing protein n=1 Tax=Xanthomonas boreopolis TaxID=86183 RepID=UPI003DA13EAE
MSISLDKLRALRKQAGGAVKPAEASEPAVHATARENGRAPATSTRHDARRAAARGDASDEGCLVGGTSVSTGLPSDAESPHKSPSGLKSLPQKSLPQNTPAPQGSAFAWIDASASPAAPVRNASHDLDALRRLLGLRERKPTASASAPARPAAVDRTLPGQEIAPGLWRIEAFLPQPIPAAPLSLAFARRPDDAVAPRDLLFFDTETTGLAGGTGTRAFMIGAADWHVDAAGREGLRVRQLLMATMAAETAMLREFAGWLGPATVLSSYNGRCYDAPLLKTRFRLARLAEPLGALDHVDLLFPTRRRYRGHWENCRLATIERHLLRIVREDDLPGSEAPAAWLTWLRGGSARNLHRVAAHNHQDVVTLALLFRRLVEAEAEERTALRLQEAGMSESDPPSNFSE